MLEKSFLVKCQMPLLSLISLSMNQQVSNWKAVLASGAGAVISEEICRGK